MRLLKRVLVDINIISHSEYLAIKKKLDNNENLSISERGTHLCHVNGIYFIALDTRSKVREKITYTLADSIDFLINSYEIEKELSYKLRANNT